MPTATAPKVASVARTSPPTTVTPAGRIPSRAYSS
jgi:hypothetical protein